MSPLRHIVLALAATNAAWAQQPQAQPQRPPVPRAALSTRATVEVLLNGRLISGEWRTGPTAIAGPARIAIDYGQPHARGRSIVGGLVPWDSVWRTGAN
ncbi:MAG: DUF2911 domain-containing protein, partial [Gemmatimonadetes bacterium]|nr:DUF2911 domain-containing protein [Gemmatimonadota bacterium]